MSNTTVVMEHTIDSILEQLDRFHQRATYGAVAALVNSSPRSLMLGRERNMKSSWIVSRTNGQPTGYQPDHKHPDLESREEILDTPGALRSWLADPG